MRDPRSRIQMPSNPRTGEAEGVLCLVQTPTLAVFALDHFTAYMTYFLYLAEVRMKTASACRTFHYLKGCTYSFYLAVFLF